MRAVQCNLNFDMLNFKEIHEFLEEKYLQYNPPGFIESDPICIPHRFSRKEDIEIAGFLTAVISWGNRRSIIASADRLMALMDHSPANFIRGFSDNELQSFYGFKHRTFNGDDSVFFMKSLQNIYHRYGGLEPLFTDPLLKGGSIRDAIIHFRKTFTSLPHLRRTEKHISDPASGSAAKRINMFLRWMVRRDRSGVDFGLWKGIDPSVLFCPLDVHTGHVARKLGLLTRRSNDWRAVEELTSGLALHDPQDPVKYDIALFGLGVYEKF